MGAVVLKKGYKETDEYKNASRAEKTAMNRAYAEQERQREKAAQEAKAKREVAKFNEERVPLEAALTVKALRYYGLSNTVVERAGALRQKHYSLLSGRGVLDVATYELFKGALQVKTTAEANASTWMSINTSEIDDFFYPYISEVCYRIGGEETSDTYAAFNRALDSLINVAIRQIEELDAILDDINRVENEIKARNALRDKLRKELPPEQAALLTPNE